MRRSRRLLLTCLGGLVLAVGSCNMPKPPIPTKLGVAPAPGASGQPSDAQGRAGSQDTDGSPSSQAPLIGLSR